MNKSRQLPTYFTEEPIFIEYYPNETDKSKTEKIKCYSCGDQICRVKWTVDNWIERLICQILEIQGRKQPNELSKWISIDPKPTLFKQKQLLANLLADAGIQG